MTYFKTGIDQPGIVELLFYKGSTGKALSQLAHTLLHGPSGLSSGDRELIASYVSNLNDCDYCHEAHSAAANAHLNDDGAFIVNLNNVKSVKGNSQGLKLIFENIELKIPVARGYVKQLKRNTEELKPHSNS